MWISQKDIRMTFLSCLSWVFKIVQWFVSWLFFVVVAAAVVVVVIQCCNAVELSPMRILCFRNRPFLFCLFDHCLYHQRCSQLSFSVLDAEWQYYSVKKCNKHTFFCRCFIWGHWSSYWAISSTRQSWGNSEDSIGYTLILMHKWQRTVYHVDLVCICWSGMHLLCVMLFCMWLSFTIVVIWLFCNLRFAFWMRYGNNFTIICTILTVPTITFFYGTSCEIYPYMGRGWLMYI